jgi:hypothetical protein
MDLAKHINLFMFLTIWPRVCFLLETEILERLSRAQIWFSNVQICMCCKTLILQAIWLIDWLFYVPLKNFSLIRRGQHYRWRAAKFRLISALRAIEQRRIIIMPHLLWLRASGFPVLSKGLPHSIASYNTQGDVEDLFLPGSLRVPSNIKVYT